MATETAAASLDEILNAREQRVKRQREALTQWGMPLISLTLVMPGPVKDSEMSRYLISEATGEINRLCRQQGWQIAFFERIDQIAGPEALFVVNTEARILKQALIRLEEVHPLGRLWDMDVLTIDGVSISRRDLGLDGRRCLVCDKPGHICTRSQAHTLGELLQVIAEKVAAYQNRPAGGS